jgi:hypothetical protein
MPAGQESREPVFEAVFGRAPARRRRAPQPPLRGAAVVPGVAVGVPIVVCTGEGKGVGVLVVAGVAVAVALAVAVAVAVAAAVALAVAVAVAVAVAEAASTEAAPAVAVAVTAGVGEAAGSSAGAVAPSTALNRAALTRPVARMRRVTTLRVGTRGTALEPDGPIRRPGSPNLTLDSR